MMPLIQPKIYELGRRLGKQGPRRFSRPQPPAETVASRTGDKCVTVDKFSFSILQLNANGLGHAKILELNKLLFDKKIQVALIQETMWSKDKDVKFSFPGFTPYRCSCHENCQGMVTLINNSLDAEVSNVPTNDGNDIQKVELWKNGQHFRVFNIYSPPGVICNAHLHETNFRKTILAGDTNAHSPMWGYQDTNASGDYVEDILNSTNLILLQNKDSPPTFFHRPSGACTRPDQTLISADIQEQCSWDVLDDLGSDHLPILISIAMEKKKGKPKRKTAWNYSKADWEEYRTMTRYQHSKIDLQADIHTTSTQFTQAILSSATKSIPKGNRAKFSVYWNGDLEEAVNLRKKAWKAKRDNKSQENNKQYRLSAKVKLISKKSRRTTWEKTTAQLDLRKDGRKAWSLLGKLSGENKRTNPAPIETDTGKATTDTEKATAFTKFYTSITKNHKRPNIDRGFKRLTRSLEKRNGPFESVFVEKFTRKELDFSLKKCKLKKAPGPDEVTNEMLVQLGDASRGILLHIINKSWETGSLPKIWKTANITPILKKDKPKSKVSSYRPISLTSCICKLVERMINRRLYSWLEKSGKLHKNQAGFRKGRQTIDQLIRLAQQTADAFQQKKSVAAVFVDLKQAYDHVWRDGLLLKMQKIGIQGNMYNWIRNFLQDRTIATKINGTLSPKRTLEEGLPQGSALSCTLFLIYINDLADNINVETALFADDLVLWTTGKHFLYMQRQLNKALSVLSIFCELWKLKINTSKTVYSIFTLSPVHIRTTLHLQVQGTTIQKDNNPKYLGVRLDPKLSFNTHFQDIADKVAKRLNLLKRLASTNWGTNKTTLRQLYTGYVRAVFDYSAPLQATASNTSQRKLDRLQNQGLRFVCGALKTTPSSACEIDANVEPLRLRRERSTALTLERFRRLEPDNPCREMVENWEPTNRIKKKSFLKTSTILAEQNRFPEERVTSGTIPLQTPHQELKRPKTHTLLLNGVDKSSLPPILKSIALETISSYPDSAIHAYTDGSAVRAIHNGGYGSVINAPDRDEPIHLSGPCGAYCTNYDAEVVAIQKTLDSIQQHIDNRTIQPNNIVIFSDSQSAIQAVENWQEGTAKGIENILQSCDKIMTLHGIEITIQWIPGHCDINLNEKADGLAKQGSHMQQENVEATYDTAKQIARQNTQEVWYNNWMEDEKGRRLYRNLPTPNPKDPINFLERRDQCNIFRLRTGHIMLNGHRNRIDPLVPPMCRHCGDPYETVEHHLFHCVNLSNLRNNLLPPHPTLENCLYGDTSQLKKTSKFHILASRVN